MSLTFKIGSLAIRTLAKPLSNYIKRNATQHENFRALCIGFAQRLHRVDMRLRLGLLQDPAAIERQIQRELKEVEKRRIAQQAPTVKTEAETKAEEVVKAKEKKEVEEHVKAAHKPPRIRPLSENKAIETGANFIAETFLFLVAGALIFAESWRRDRKDKKQDADVAAALKLATEEREEMKEKLELLQAEIEALMDNKKPFDSVRAAAVASLHKPASTVIRPSQQNDGSQGSSQHSPAPTTAQPPGQSAGNGQTAASTAPAGFSKEPSHVNTSSSAALAPSTTTTSAIPTPSASNTPNSTPHKPATDLSASNQNAQPSSTSSWLPSWLTPSSKGGGTS